MTSAAASPAGSPHRGFAYSREIDGLRAIAVLAVVVYHAVPAWLPGGFVGVDVFFVISGYLITSLLVAERDRTGRIDVPAFYARRAKRLLPALFVVVGATVAMAVWSAPGGDFVSGVLASAAASLLFVANLYFQATTGGYFDGPSDEVPLLHLWSLGVEEQYYLVYPLLLALWLRGGRGSARNLVALCCVLSILAAEALVSAWPAVAFHQMPARFWELGAGALLALSGRHALGRRSSGALATAGVSIIVASAAWPGTVVHFPGLGALPAVVGACLVIFSVHGSAVPGWVGGWLRSRPVVGVGLASYGFYLWHWPLLAMDRVTTLGTSAPSRRIALCVLALVLAAAMWRLVEQPVRAARGRPVRSVLKLAAAAIAVGLGGLLLLGQRYESPQGIAELAARAARDRPAMLDTCHYGVRSDVRALHGAACRSGEGAPRMMLWGDSHAIAWQPFVWELASARGVVASIGTMDSCTPLRHFAAERSDAPRHRENCARLNALVLEEVGGGGYETVVIAARWLGLFDPSADDGPPPGRKPMPAEAVVSELEAAVAALASVPEILIMMPPPESPFTVARCLASRHEQACSQDRAAVGQRRSAVAEALGGIAARHANVTLVDPVAFFCDDETCPIRRGELVYYWDDDHVSASASRAFGKAFVRDPRPWRASAKPSAVAPP